MDDKSFYFVTNWDDAADYARALEAMDIPHTVEAPGEELPLDQGELAIILPHLSDQQYKKVRTLFDGDAKRYPK